MKRSHKYLRRILIVFAGVTLLYAFLLIPGHDESLSSTSNDRVEKQPFAWNQDDYWNSLEAKYRDAQKSGCQGSETVIASHRWYLLPIARLVKAYSVILNAFGKAGPIPEGMSATAALRTEDYGEKNKAIEERLAAKAEQYKKKHGYEARYWALVSMGREVKKGD